MISYKLAKQLKDKRYPGSEDWKEEKGKMYFGFDNVLEPTLSELIESCGDSFKLLTRFKEDMCIWIAGDDIDHYITEGKTPEEAVAKLWLELNKKK